MLLNLLANAEDGGANYTAYIVIAVLAVLMIVLFVFSGRKNKQQRKQYEEELAAICSGTKVKTIGGICGVVVEVCGDNTFVIETGSEESGKSYVKIDKSCIAQTDLHLTDNNGTAAQTETVSQTEPAPQEAKAAAASEPIPEVSADTAEEQKALPSEEPKEQS